MSGNHGELDRSQNDPAATKDRQAPEWPHWVILGMTWVAAMVGLVLAPDRIPTHWNLRGEPDDWGSKWFGLLLTPLLAVGLYLLLRFLPRLDPARRNYDKFSRAYAAIRLAMVAMMAGIELVIVAAAIGLAVNVGLCISVGIGVLFIVLGWLMGDIEPNWFVGVRTPWTLTSEASWRQTHRAARWVFMIGGVLLSVAGAAQETWLFLAVLVAFLAAVLGLVVYSYWVWKKDPNRIQAPPVESP